MQFCSEPGCGVLVSSGRCEKHAPRAQARLLRPVYAQAHRWYTSVRWQRLRLEVLQEQPLCRSCLALGRKVVTSDIDHIRKHAGDEVLFWDRRNLQGLCKGCHTAKTSRGE